MSDHIEHSCGHCGSLLHYTDKCPDMPTDALATMIAAEDEYERRLAESLAKGDASIDEALVDAESRGFSCAVRALRDLRKLLLKPQGELTDSELDLRIAFRRGCPDIHGPHVWQLADYLASLSPQPPASDPDGPTPGERVVFDNVLRALRESGIDGAQRCVEFLTRSAAINDGVEVTPVSDPEEAARRKHERVCVAYDAALRSFTGNGNVHNPRLQRAVQAAIDALDAAEATEGKS